MAQAGYTPIRLYVSTSAGVAPSAGNLANGELAINITDGKLFYKDNGGVVQVLAGKSGTGVVAGSNTQLQFNNNGVFGASSGLTWDGTYLTASQVRSSGLTSGRVTYAGASGQLVDSANLLYSGTDLTVYGITVGRGAGAVSTNTAVGASALAANTSGTANTALGYQAGYTNSTGSNLTLIGYGAGRSATAGFNTLVGSFAGYSNTSGTKNVAVGGDDGTANPTFYANTTGSFNTAIGISALGSNTTASNNTAVGYQAGYSNTTGGSNTSLGIAAGYSCTVGGGNLFVGRDAGGSLTSGNYNTFVGGYSSGGFGAGYYITTGSKNTILGGYNGNQGGLDIRTANNYIVLSDGDGNPKAVNGAYPSGAGAWIAGANIWTLGLGGTSPTYDGYIALNGSTSSGYGATILAYSNGTGIWQAGTYAQVVTGTSTFFAVKNTGGGVYLNGASATSWTAVSDETRKIIIEPITDAANKVSTLRAVIGRLKDDDETVRRPYLIAQDVQAVLPEAVSEAEDKDGPVLGLSYTEVIPLLVAAIKELKADLDTTKAELAALKGA